ncbi:MAG: sulfatase [Verrucomicrobiota bacterium]
MSRVHLTALLFFALLTSLVAAPNATHPNILFIMSDDHAAHAVSAYGSKINQTPNIDRLAKEGIRFNNCFAVNSICTPSRASILTGKYSHINGVPAFNRFDGSQWTVAKALQAAGYHTGMIGKWHLQSDPTGFDYWNVLTGQGLYHDPVFIEMGERKKITGYATDLITDMSIEFLKNRPKDKPFFLMTHHKAPHREWSPDAKHAALFSAKTIPEPETLNDDYATRSDAARTAIMRVDRDLTRGDLKLPPPPGLRGTNLTEWKRGTDSELEVVENGKTNKLSGAALRKWKYQRYMKDYLACVASVDDNVGRLLDYLDQTGLATNTIVIYTSDQGFFLGDHGWFDKRFMYEESIRMPFLVRYPPAIKPGSVSEVMILNVDFAPTFLEFAGLPTPAEVQGRSIQPLLSGKTTEAWRKSWYYRYYHYPNEHGTEPHYGVRTERHKLIYFHRINQWELFDLKDDPRELKNIVNDPKQTKLVTELQTELARLRKELDDRDQFTALPQSN